MKLTIGIIAIIICTFFAYRASVKYTKRKVFYDDFGAFNDKLKSEIAFSKNTILSLVASINDESDFGVLLKRRFNKNENVNALYEGSIARELKYLKRADVDFINDYFYSIGKADGVTELKIINKYGEEIFKNLSVAVSDEKKYRPLYVKLGFLLGILVLILLL